MIEILHKFWWYFLLGTVPDGPLGGLALTICIAIVSLAITMPLSLVIALARASRRKLLRRTARVYIYLMRGLPLLFLLMWIYFFVPEVTGLTISPFWTVVIAIVLYQGAYLSEVIRGGIEALPKGQTEAARALGLSERLITWKIILPQALYNVIPGIVNQFTIIIKESSLGYVIALGELTYVAGRVNALLMTEALSVYAILALIYFILCFALSRVVNMLETRVSRRRNADPSAVADTEAASVRLASAAIGDASG